MNCPKCKSENISKNGSFRNKPKIYCNECNSHSLVNPIKDSDFSSEIKESKRYVITCAQNDTDVHKGFLEALKHYDAELIVIPIFYKNVSLYEKVTDYSWHKSLEPFLKRGRFNLGKNVTVLADIKTQPTATNPLSGFDNISGHRAAIIGHPQIELKSIAVPSYKYPKIITTTGAITLKNYSDTKAGKKGEFHHSIGACVVEVDGDNYWIRQIHAASDGSFYDLDKLYTPKGVEIHEGVEAFVCGDEHVAFKSEVAEKATFWKNGIVETLKPKYIVRHDLLDFYSRNHHHKGDPFISKAKQNSSFMSVKDEVLQAIDHVNKTTPENSTSVIVASNHIDALTRWLKETDWRNDPANAEFYLETALYMCQNSKIDNGGASYPDPFEYWAKKHLTCNHEMPGRKKGFMIKGIDVSMHGDVGANGARGSINNLSKLATKSIVGHSHSPGIKFGCYQVGTFSRLDLEYQRGASSWCHAGCVIYPNGSRSLIIFVKERWKL